MLIGIVGKSGSGKSIISRAFKELNQDIQVLDVDKIGHKSHDDKEVREKLLLYFGTTVFNVDGTVNRKALSSIVFNDQKMMQKLYDATLHFMEREIDSLIAKAKITILDYALLPKLKYFKACDIKILVKSPYVIRANRVISRDNISLDKYNEIDSNSLTYDDKEFDYIIENNGTDINKLRKVVNNIYEKGIISGQF